MIKASASLATFEGWQTLIRKFKESLAKRLWAMPTVSESEKQIVFKEYLSDLDNFEKELATFNEEAQSRLKLSNEENDLLRSLLGVPGDELKARSLALTNELNALRTHTEEIEEELAAVKEKSSTAELENTELRKRIVELEAADESKSLEHLKSREIDIKYYSEKNEALKNHLADLETRLLNLRTLFSESNKKLAAEKQEEISLLQRKLFEEMEQALREKQQLSWAEEEMFAKGVAQKVRTVLVSAQGQLFLTLEQLGLLDPESKTESFWKTRFKIFVQGAEELGKNFRSLQAQLQDVTKSLDDYLHLTHRRELGKENVSLPELIKKEMADLYLERRPSLSFEFIPDDPLPDVKGDRELLQHAVHSLIMNAVESLPNETGNITITLRNKSDQGHVELTVRDGGRGIPEHLVPKLFQPFLTTKPGRQGLSLSRARRFVELQDGTLSLVETSPRGTTFQMNLKTQGRR